jgi:hypothetical protein
MTAGRPSAAGAGGNGDEDALRPASTPVLALRGHFGLLEVRSVCRQATALLETWEPPSLVCDVRGLAAVDLGAVAAVTRVALLCREAGCRISLRGASPELRDFLAFLGLAGVVPCEDGPSVEVVGEAEHREEALGVQEEDDPPDGAA